MPYGNEPASEPRDAVRFYIGDTNNDRLMLTDAEIAFLLAQEGDSALRAAARAAETLGARFTKAASLKKVGPLQINNSTSSGLTKAQEYAALARRLWARAGLRSGGGPYAGGINIYDKRERAQAGDLAKPAFTRHMMEIRDGEPQQASMDDLLGRDYDAP